jgi:RimJ/RimL family protein N-acetyltransferase
MTDRVTNVPLPDGHTLTIRPATIADIDGLLALYESLSHDDRHLRFFTQTRPRRQVMEHFIESNNKNGLWLVAVTDGGEIVADGGYTRLPDGDAEFALTVRKDWRGWLGSFLLDLLLHDAGEHDIDNLRAVVLRENRPMMRLIERHGYACIDQPDWAIVEATVSTHGDRPSWPPVHTNRRLLVESCGGRWHADVEAWHAGWDVVTCPGPGARSVGVCPMLEGRRCLLVDGADAVVVAAHPNDPHHDELVAAHRATGTSVPVVDEAEARPADVSTLLRGGKPAAATQAGAAGSDATPAA